MRDTKNIAHPIPTTTRGIVLKKKLEVISHFVEPLIHGEIRGCTYAVHMHLNNPIPAVQELNFQHAFHFSKKNCSTEIMHAFK